MTTTPGLRCAPRRIADPPGTTRTPSFNVITRAETSDLSTAPPGHDGSAVSVLSEKAARITRLTQVYAVQAPASSRSAARMVPASRAPRASWTRAVASGSAVISAMGRPKNTAKPGDS